MAPAIGVDITAVKAPRVFVIPVNDPSEIYYLYYNYFNLKKKKASLSFFKNLLYQHNWEQYLKDFERTRYLRLLVMSH